MTTTNESPAPQPPVEGLREALEACEYCGPGKHSGLPGGACENCMNTGLKSPPLTAEPSQVGLNWEISAETKAQIEDIEANTRRAHLNAHNIIVGSPATLTEQSGKK